MKERQLRRKLHAAAMANWEKHVQWNQKEWLRKFRDLVRKNKHFKNFIAGKSLWCFETLGSQRPGRNHVDFHHPNYILRASASRTGIF